MKSGPRRLTAFLPRREPGPSERYFRSHLDIEGSRNNVPFLATTRHYGLVNTGVSLGCRWELASRDYRCLFTSVAGTPN